MAVCVFYFVSSADRDVTRLLEDRDVSNAEIRKTQLNMLIIYIAGQKVMCGKESGKKIPRRTVANREKETHSEV